MSFGTYNIGTVSYGGGSGGNSVIYYTITLVDPADAATSSFAKPTFTSLPLTNDGSNANIEWQWDTNPSFTNPNSLQQTKSTAGNVSNVNAATTPDTAFQSYTWYWRVRAGDGVSNWSDYTAPWSLAVTSPIAMTSATYIYENVGLSPAITEDTEDAHIYIYENVGIAPAVTEDSEDGHMYIYENVQTRPGGSKETMPPTHN